MERDERITLQDCELGWHAEAFTLAEAAELFAELRETLPWHQEQLVIFGRERPVPRLISWHGDPAAQYAYSGVPHEPAPWTPALERVRERVQRLAGKPFNSVLGNLYRDGRDGMGWHSDDEPELGRNPLIASVSFGATRRFRLRHRRDRTLTHALDLTDGSVLVMAGATQHHWQHSITKTARPVGPRINLTYRRIAETRR